MFKIPSEIQIRFDNYLFKELLPAHKHHYYKKWFRYYWDFCHKYFYPIAEKDSLEYFVDKLREKKQKDFQIQQASHAVSIYYKIVKEDIGYIPGSFKNNSADISNKNLMPIQEKQQENNRYEIVNHSLHISESNFDKNLYAPVEDTGKSILARNKEFINKNVKHSSIKSNAIKSKPVIYNADWRSAYNDLKAEIKLRHYSPKTYKSYNTYIKRFQTFTKSKNIELLSDSDIKEFLTFMAVKQNVSASTQNLAFNALLFFFRHVLKKEPGDLKGIPRAKRKPYIPVVLSREEIAAVLQNLSLPYDLVVKMLYGCGLRLFECPCPTA